MGKVLIKRTLQAQLEKLAQQFPVVAVLGPRQSGKTTLVQQVFPNYGYVSLEDLDRRAAVQADPRGFLASFASTAGLIIDEIQLIMATLINA